MHQFLFAKSHLGNVAWLHLSFEYWLPGLQATYSPSEPKEQRKGRIPTEDCDEFSILLGLSSTTKDAAGGVHTPTV